MITDRLDWRAIGIRPMAGGLNVSPHAGLYALEQNRLHLESTRHLYGFLWGVWWLGRMPAYLRPQQDIPEHRAAFRDATKWVERTVARVQAVMRPLVPFEALLSGASELPPLPADFTAEWEDLEPYTCRARATRGRLGVVRQLPPELPTPQSVIRGLLGETSPETMQDAFCILQGVRQTTVEAIRSTGLPTSDLTVLGIVAISLSSWYELLPYVPQDQGGDAPPG
jgi:hypothetical protein